MSSQVSRPQEGYRPPAGSGSRLSILAALALLPLAVLPRLAFFAGWRENFDADEALIALQALDLLRGQFTLFLPGQSYMGLLQGIVAAPLVALLGSHANVVRLSPLLWVIPGFLALRALERRGRGLLGWGRGAWLLAVLWLFPPAVLFLAGVKARGGNLEGLVLGLWSAALLWPRSPVRFSGRDLGGWICAGLLFGLGLWTHDQTLLFAPVLLWLLLLPRQSRVARLGAFAAGFLAGYLPLWLPRLIPFGLGPPGTEGAGWQPVLTAPFSSTGFPRLPALFAAALTTGVKLRGIDGLLLALHIIASGLGLLGGLWFWLRTSQRAKRDDSPAMLTSIWRSSPALTVSLWLAAANLAALLVSPEYFADSQWFRYTLGLSPLLVVACALALRKLPPRLGWTGAAILALLSVQTSSRAVSGWDFPRSGDRGALVSSLEQRGIRRVLTDWQLAYALRFFSRDGILCSSQTPPRYPEINALVEFSPQAWTVAPRPSSSPGPLRPGAEDAVDRAFRITPRVEGPPAEACAVFARLDLSRTLFPHFEPFPLLKADEFQRDWRGWPYRRPLRSFTAIVWQPEHANQDPATRERITAALQQLEASGEFTPAAEWGERRILLRAR